MKYVDAGYVICMGSLFVYAVSLIVRRARLERAVEVAARDNDGNEGRGDAGKAASVDVDPEPSRPPSIDGTPELTGGRVR